MLYSTIVGIDTHSKKNAVCAIVPATGEMREAVLSEDPEQLLAWIVEQDFPKPVGCVYESGPTGFGLARSLVAGGVACTVAATSKLSYRVDRQKNDRVDAKWLAQQMIAGGVREVRVPTPEEESLCHLSRLRGEVAADLRKAKQRVSSFLLLTGTEYTLTKKKWSKTFRKWAASCEFDQPADTFAFRCKMSAVLRLEERLAEVDEKYAAVDREARRLDHAGVAPSPALDALLADRGEPPCPHGARLGDLLRRPRVSYDDLAPFDAERPALSREITRQVEISVKYQGYIDRQNRQVEEMKKLEGRPLPPNMDYQSIQGLRLEARQKLSQIRPLNLGQASRISGVSPADLTALMIYLERG